MSESTTALPRQNPPDATPTSKRQQPGLSDADVERTNLRIELEAAERRFQALRAEYARVQPEGTAEDAPSSARL